MVVNDNAGCLIDRVVWTSIASKLRSYRGSRSLQTRLKEKWRKVAGVEPARERMPSPTGFEARPRHRARLPS